MEPIEVIFYIEALSNDKKTLERAVEQTVESLKGEKNLTVKDLFVGDVMEDEESELLRYSSVIETRIRGPLSEVTMAALKYSPAIVEVLEPPKLEIGARELMKLLGNVAYFMGGLMEKFGGLAVYPNLEEYPEPKIGYTREEVEEMIVEDRHVLYRFVIEVYHKGEEETKRDMAKALAYEGCKINKLVVQKHPEDDKKFLLAAEVLSDFETLFQLMAKYVPVAISIMEPEIIDVTAAELQNALTDLAGFVQELVTRPIKKQLIDKANTTFKLNP